MASDGHAHPRGLMIWHPKRQLSIKQILPLVWAGFDWEKRSQTWPAACSATHVNAAQEWASTGCGANFKLPALWMTRTSYLEPATPKSLPYPTDRETGLAGAWGASLGCWISSPGRPGCQQLQAPVKGLEGGLAGLTEQWAAGTGLTAVWWTGCTWQG